MRTKDEPDEIEFLWSLDSFVNRYDERSGRGGLLNSLMMLILNSPIAMKRDDESAWREKFMTRGSSFLFYSFDRGIVREFWKRLWKTEFMMSLSELH